MGNTIVQAELVKLSQRIYKDWRNKTVLVQSCDDSFEGEFSLETREIDIPIYHDISVYTTTLKEAELKPAALELVKSSVKRVTMDKGRYSHWGSIKINKLIEKLNQEESETRKRLVAKWASEAEKELGIWCAKLPAAQTIDTTDTDIIAGDGITDRESIITVLDVLKAHAVAAKMTPSDFKLFVSEKFETILRDAKLLTGYNLDANEAFRNGYVDVVNGVEVRKIEIPELTTRDTKTKMVKAEWGIWKSKDGIQYVVPYKNTISYEITPDEVLLGGTGYQQVEYYDFFNIYPTRLYKVHLRYVSATNAPTL